MTIDEIRKKAPSGATHYYFVLNGTIVRYARKSKFLWFFNKYEGWMYGIEIWNDLLEQHICKLKPLN